MFKNQF